MKESQENRLVNATTLLEQLFEPNSRPSLRWLRTQMARQMISYHKIGRLTFFDVEQVRRELAENTVIRAR